MGIAGMKQNKSLIIGLTGGIAAGKSTVSRLLEENGIAIIDADVIAREVVDIGSFGVQAVVDYFGNDILNKDQSLNRSKLGELVFNDANKLNQLNAILHPLITERVEILIEEYASSGAEVIVIDAALLIEAGWNRLVDLVILIDIDEETQINRLMTRNHITREYAQRMIKKQANREYKQQVADKIIINNGSEEELNQKVIQLVAEIKDKKSG
jgi:dephospho-CoA kinase